jgi:Leucine-rich repeat (LRR) protein
MNLTASQILNGIWLFNDKANWDQRIIKYPEQYNSEERIMLDFTQLRAAKNYKEEKLLINKWCDYFTSMTNLKYLYFECRINQQIFDSICKMTFLEGIYIKWSNITDISKISDLINLSHIHIGSSPKIYDFSPLVKLRNLITLEIENNKQLADLSIIGNMKNLEGLGIHGSLWKTQDVNTLKPIARLSNLKYLTLYGTKVLDHSLDTLISLQSLQRVWVAPYYRMVEYEKVFKSLPNLVHGNIIEIMTSEDYRKQMKIKP